MMHIAGYSGGTKSRVVMQRMRKNDERGEWENTPYSWRSIEQANSELATAIGMSNVASRGYEYRLALEIVTTTFVVL